MEGVPTPNKNVLNTYMEFDSTKIAIMAILRRGCTFRVIPHMLREELGY